MFKLHMDPKSFGLARADTVKSNFKTLEDAQRQAGANIRDGKCEPWFITDDAEEKVVDYQAMSADERAELGKKSQAEADELALDRFKASQKSRSDADKPKK